ncbi:MAG TPA: hypothetical protein VF905_07625, partial [Nitrospirota bacterium]
IGGMAAKLGMEEEFEKVHQVIPPTRKTEWDAQTDTIKNFNVNLVKNMDKLVEEESMEKVASMLMGMNHLTGLIHKKTDRKAGQAEIEEVREASQKRPSNDNAESMRHAA